MNIVCYLRKAAALCIARQEAAAIVEEHQSQKELHAVIERYI